MFRIFKFTALMFKCFFGVTGIVSKAAGTAIGAGVIASEVIKDHKKSKEIEKKEEISDEE